MNEKIKIKEKDYIKKFTYTTEIFIKKNIEKKFQMNQLN
jgi:hypothetical protein